MDDDSILLRRYAEDGSEAAFSELVTRRIGLVYGSALRQLGDPHRAQEVVQEVFTDLARKASSLCRRPVLVSWLYTSTHFAVGNLRRKERRQRIRDHEAHLMQAIDSSGDHAADWARLRPVLDLELHALDPRDRDAVLLRYFEGKSFAGIGDALSLSEEAARKRVDRALERLRVRMNGRGIASTAAVLSALLTEQAGIAAPAELAAAVAKTALLQSAAAGVGTAGVLTIMSTSKTILGIAALLALVGIGSAVFERQNAVSSCADLASLQASYAANSAEMDSLAAKVAAAEKAAASLSLHTQPLARATGGSAASTVAGLSPAAAPVSPRARGDAFMARHPEVKQALIAYVDATHLAQFGAFYAAQGFAPDKIQQMQELLRLGYSFGRTTQTGTVTLAAVDTDSANQGAEQEEGLKALLGDEGFEQFATYQHTVPARDAATNLASLLASTDSPLSAGQAQQMTTVLANSSPKQAPSQFDWSMVYTSAEGILSPPQLEMLRTMGSQSQAWQNVVAAMAPR